MALSDPIDALERQLDDIALARAGADAAADVMREATASYIGGDLSMSGLRDGDTAEIDTSRTSAGHVEIVGVGGTFALADRGRKRRTTAHARRGSALDTPWGPRMSVDGSTWGGFGITARHGSEALRAASAAVVDGITWG